MFTLEKELKKAVSHAYVIVVYSGDKQGYILVHTPSRMEFVPVEVGRQDTSYSHDTMRCELNEILEEWGFEYRCLVGGGQYGPYTWTCPLTIGGDR